MSCYQPINSTLYWSGLDGALDGQDTLDGGQLKLASIPTPSQTQIFNNTYAPSYRVVTLFDEYRGTFLFLGNLCFPNM